MYKLTDLYKQIKEEAAFIPKYKIYSDMDGVLTDFDRRFQQFGAMLPKEYEAKHGSAEFWDLIDNKVGHTFWSEMSWMPDGKKLWEYIKKYKPTLLSAPSKKATSRYGKRLWVEKNLPGSKLILAPRAHKKNYAEPNHILIDDRVDTINEWIQKGGVGIVHTSAEQTINSLKKLGL